MWTWLSSPASALPYASSPRSAHCVQRGTQSSDKEVHVQHVYLKLGFHVLCELTRRLPCHTSWLQAHPPRFGEDSSQLESSQNRLRELFVCSSAAYRPAILVASTAGMSSTHSVPNSSSAIFCCTSLVTISARRTLSSFCSFLSSMSSATIHLLEQLLMAMIVFWASDSASSGCESPCFSW